MKCTRLLVALALVLASVPIFGQSVTIIVKDADGNAVTNRIIDFKIQFKGGDDVLIDKVYRRQTDEYLGVVNIDLKEDLEGKTLDPMTDYYACYEFGYLGDTIRKDSIPVHKATQSITSEHAATADHAITADQATMADVANTATMALQAQSAATALNADNAAFAATANVAQTAEQASQLLLDPVLEEGQYGLKFDSEGNQEWARGLGAPDMPGIYNIQNIDDGSTEIKITYVNADGTGIAPDEEAEAAGVEYQEITEAEINQIIDNLNSASDDTQVAANAGRRYRNSTTGETYVTRFDRFLRRFYRYSPSSRRTPGWSYLNGDLLSTWCAITPMEVSGQVYRFSRCQHRCY